MNRIIFDTNIVIAALISNKGASYRLIRWLFETESVINGLSLPMLFELEDVMFRKNNRKLYPQFSDDDLNLFLDDICSISDEIRIGFLWRPFLKDIKDDKVLEAAFNAEARYIVTHNLRDFAGIDAAFGIEAIPPYKYLQIAGVLT